MSGQRVCNRRRGDDSSGPPGQNADGLRPLLSDGELLGKVLQRVAGLPGRSGSPGSGACRTHSYLPGPAIGGDHQSGHRLTEGPRCDFRCPKGKVRRCVQFLH